MKKYSVGIFGGSGMTGGELLRWIFQHPSLSLSFVYSRHQGGKKLEAVHPFLKGFSDLSFTDKPPERLVSQVDVVFLALRHGESAKLWKEIESFDGCVVDLSGDHRLKDPSFYPSLYGFSHPNPSSLSDFLYSVPELVREKLPGWKRISNPGCFATACLLSTAPLVQSHWIKDSIFISAITGSSGSGNQLSFGTHHPFRDGNVVSYKVFSHPHEVEINEMLQRISVESPALTLATHSGPFVRGILATARGVLSKPCSSSQLFSMFSEFYSESPFVRVLSEPCQIKSVVGSNFCDLYVASRGKEVLVWSALDNLVKGAAGQAIQNLNLALSLPEKEGLWSTPLFP